MDVKSMQHLSNTNKPQSVNKKRDTSNVLNKRKTVKDHPMSPPQNELLFSLKEDQDFVLSLMESASTNSDISNERENSGEKRSTDEHGETEGGEEEICDCCFQLAGENHACEGTNCSKVTVIERDPLFQSCSYTDDPICTLEDPVSLHLSIEEVDSPDSQNEDTDDSPNCIFYESSNTKVTEKNNGNQEDSKDNASQGKMPTVQKHPDLEGSIPSTQKICVEENIKSLCQYNKGQRTDKTGLNVKRKPPSKKKRILPYLKKKVFKGESNKNSSSTDKCTHKTFNEKCPDCMIYFKYEKTYLYHRFVEHGNVHPYEILECSECSFKTYCVSLLSSHYSKTHTNGFKQKCYFCMYEIDYNEVAVMTNHIIHNHKKVLKKSAATIMNYKKGITQQEERDKCSVGMEDIPNSEEKISETHSRRNSIESVGEPLKLNSVPEESRNYDEKN